MMDSNPKAPGRRLATILLLGLSLALPSAVSTRVHASAPSSSASPSDGQEASQESAQASDENAERPKDAKANSSTAAAETEGGSKTSPAPEAGGKTSAGAGAIRGVLGRSVLLDHMRADALGFLESKHYGAALALADEAIALHSGFLPAHEIRLEALRLGEGPQAAEAAARELIERFPRHFAFRRELARSLLDQARYDEALDALSGRTPRAAISETSYLRALIYASAGIDAEALIELEASARAGLSSIERVKDEPVFASLRGLERFEGVVARIAVNHDEIERRRSDPLYGLDLGREERFSLPAEDLIERLEHAMQTGLRREVRYELDDLRGGKLRSDDRKDRFQVIFFWSHWSAAANAMLPDLERLQAEYRERGVEVVVLAAHLYSTLENFTTATLEHIAKESVDLPVAIIGGHEASSNFGVRTVPQTLIAIPGGTCYLHARGPLDYDTLTELVEFHLGKHAATPGDAEGGATSAGAPPTSPDPRGDAATPPGKPGAAESSESPSERS